MFGGSGCSRVWVDQQDTQKLTVFYKRVFYTTTRRNLIQLFAIPIICLLWKIFLKTEDYDEWVTRLYRPGQEVLR
jgi:hypothetical protein